MSVDVAAGSGLIGEPLQIWLAVAPVDMRRGIDGLSTVVQEALGQASGGGGLAEAVAVTESGLARLRSEFNLFKKQ
jgi:IS66 Orf2 like protein